MGAITVNKLVTTFEFKLGKGIKEYEKILERLDKRGAKAAANMQKSMQKSVGSAAKSIEGRYGAMFKRIQQQADRIKLRSRVTVDNSQALGSLRGVESAASRVSHRLSKMAIPGLGAIGVGGGLFATGRYMASAASEMETAMTRLNTLVGPARAGGVFAKLQKFAKDTPYEMKDVLDMFVRLQGAGFDLMDRKTGQINYSAMLRLGDLAAASSKPLAELTDAMLSSKRGLGAMVDNFIGLGAKADGDGGLDTTMTDPRTGKTVAKHIKGGNTAELFDYWQRAGAREGISGGMIALSKTLEGQTAVLSDTIKNAFQKAWTAGMDKPIHKLMDRIIAGVDKLEPQAMRIGNALGKGMEAVPGVLKGIAKYGPGAAAGLGIFGAHMAGVRAIALGGGFATKVLPLFGTLVGKSMLLFNLVKVAGIGSLGSVMTAGFTGALAAGWGAIVTALTPLIVGGAIVAVVAGLGALGYYMWQYWTKGDEALAGLREKFPWLADGIKGLTEAAKDGFYGHIIPAFKNARVHWKAFSGDWAAGADVIVNDWIPKMNEAIAGFGGNCVRWFGNAKNMVNLFREGIDGVLAVLEKFPGPTGNWFGMLRDMNGWMGQGSDGPQGSGPDGASANLGGAINPVAAAKLSRAAQNAVSQSGYCLWAIKQALHTVYGNWKGAGALKLNGKSYMPGADAADAGPQLRQLGFQKIQLDRNNPMGSLPDGAILVYQRGVAGFSAKSGHIEAYDKDTNAFYYGQRTPHAAARRGNAAILQAEVYVPTAGGVAPKAPQQVTVAPPPGRSGGMAAPIASAAAPGGIPPITLNYYGTGDPMSIRNAMQQGVSAGLNSANSKYPQQSQRQ